MSTTDPLTVLPGDPEQAELERRLSWLDPDDEHTGACQMAADAFNVQCSQVCHGECVDDLPVAITATKADTGRS